MIVYTGTDIVCVSEFEALVQRSSETFLQNVFHSFELGNKKMSHLAGVFAAKESVIKALSLPAGCWKDIEIRKGNDGRPTVRLKQLESFTSNDLSIAHAGDYATAVFVGIGQ